MVLPQKEADHEYLDAVRHVLTHGEEHDDRTGVGTKRVFGYQMKFDCNPANFPLLTTKRMFFHGIVCELLWMLKGKTNIQWLHQQEPPVHIWDNWADLDGYVGNTYAKQWRNFNGRVDQIKLCTDQLRKSPGSRRIICTGWNPEDVEQMRPHELPPCHCFMQFAAMGDGLHLSMYQRSADLFLGVPFNIAQYALLLNLMAKCVGRTPGKLTMSFGDLHIYNNHTDAVHEQLSRTPMIQPAIILPFHSKGYPWEYEVNDILIMDYLSHPPIKAPIAV